jgi:hypothetical protein
MLTMAKSSGFMKLVVIAETFALIFILLYFKSGEIQSGTLDPASSKSYPLENGLDTPKRKSEGNVTDKSTVHPIEGLIHRKAIIVAAAWIRLYPRIVLAAWAPKVARMT